MDPNATASPSDKFLGAFPPSKPETAAPPSLADEFTEDDVFWTAHSSDHQNHPSTSSSPIRHRHVSRPDSFGILAALPAAEPDRARSVFFNHKASASASVSSSSSSSPSRMIPMIPKKAHADRHQSAPVNVPMMTEAMRRRRRSLRFDVVYDDEDEKEGDGDGDGDGDGEMMLPPHEVVSSRRSPRVACSVLEGAGRTLKGRDLRQVRNAVWRKTGFLD